jgi:hypothetical protein
VGTAPTTTQARTGAPLIPSIPYLKTRTLADDPNYDGFDVQVKWKGGSRNNYGGTPVLVDSVRVKNPYAIALLWNYEAEDIFGGWVFPYTVLANNKLWIQIHSAASVTTPTDTITDPNPTTLEIMGPFTLTITDFNPATGTFDIIVDADGYVVVNNATDPETVVDETLTQDDVILINDALASIKKHDILTLEVTFGTTGFGSPQGQVDLGADGLDDYTSIRTATHIRRAFRARDMARPTRLRDDQDTSHGTRHRYVVRSRSSSCNYIRLFWRGTAQRTAVGTYIHRA